VSTAEATGLWSFHPTGHPDRALLARWRSALDAWEEASAWPGSPTSSLTGGGAVAAFEEAFSARLERRALLLPSATYGLRLALEVLGIGPGDEVVVPVLDWTATYAAVTSLGARPVPVRVDPATLTIDPAAASAARTSRTRAAVACHFVGTPADVPGLRDALGLPVVEDCAGAPGSLLDGRQVGTLGDVAVFSLGPGKRLDAGEGGVLVTADRSLRERAVARSSHPLRLLRNGIDPSAAPPDALAVRPHPFAAVLGLHALQTWDPEAERADHARSARAAREAGHQVVGAGERCASAAPYVPVVVEQAGATCVGMATGAHVLPAADGLAADAADLLSRTRLIPVSR
jgi:hypothetical protein